MTGQPDAQASGGAEREPPARLDVRVTGGGDAYVAGGDISIIQAFGRTRPRRPAGRGADDRCPYPGLEPFTAPYAEWFYGREQAVALVRGRLDARLREGGPLVVLGPSGAGKSSLLAAGVLPDIADGSLPVEGSAHWRQVLLTPTAAPAVALSTAVGHDGAAQDWRSDAERCVDEILHGAGAAGLVLVVDQFEEIFTLCTDEAERRWFIEVLDRLARPPAGNALVVLGLRADFYAQCAAYEQLRAALRADPVLLDPMSEAEIEQAIRHPAEDVGLEIQDGLVELLLADLGAVGDPAPGDGTAGSWAGGLPMLAHTLRLTWQERRDGTLTVDGYRLTGGIRGAIARTAEDLFTALTPEGREVARTLFLRLVAVGRDADDARRHVAHLDLVRDLPGGGLTAAVVDGFIQHRLLTKDRLTVTIAHEALIDAWPRLKGWIEQDRAGNLIRQEMEEAAAAWRRADRDSALLYRGNLLESALSWAAGHPGDLSATAVAFLRAASRQEQRARRRRHRGIAAVTALALIAFTAAVLALRQSAAARSAATTAINNQISAETLQLAGTDPALAAQLALVAHDRAPNQDTASRLLNLENTSIATDLAVSPGAVVWSVATGPHGQLLATGSADNGVRLWDVSDPHHAVLLGYAQPPTASPVVSVAFSPDGNLLAAGNLGASGHTGGVVTLWNVTDPRHPTRLGPPLTAAGDVTGVAFSPDGHTLAEVGSAGGGGSGIVNLWDVTDPAHPAQPSGPEIRPIGVVSSLLFSPDGRLLITDDSGGDVELWGMGDTSHPAQHLSEFHAAGTPMAVSPDRGFLVVGGEHDTLEIWDIQNPRQPGSKLRGQPLAGLTSDVLSVAFSRDGRVLAVANANGIISLWNMTDPYFPNTLGQLPSGSEHAAVSLAFNPDGHTLAAAGRDGAVTLWSLPPTLLPGGGPVAFSRDGHLLATSNGITMARLWEVADPHSPVPLGMPESGASSPVGSLAFSPDGHTLALGTAGAGGGTVWLSDITDPRKPVPLTTLMGFVGGVSSVAFSPDGRTLAAGGSDGTVRLWKVTAPRAASPLGEPLRGFAGGVSSVAFSPDGRTLAAGGGDGTIRLWSVADPQAASPLGSLPTGASGGVASVVFSPDGRTLAAGGGDGTVRLWDATDPRAPSPLGDPLKGSSGAVGSVAFSPDGRTLAAGGSDGTVWRWTVGDVRAPARLGQPLTGPVGAVNSVAFSSDGHTLAIASTDATVRLLDLNAAAAIRRLCATSAGALTRDRWSQYVPQLPYWQPCAA
ncbi:nSTAND1 domain-containing NTPase [Kitasatospora sp. NPDC001175]|uniref:nSTAND1 domain-containing NTPase n=1 Tax=Kitasatospora sp. NPDC001175 TaxID=3157103 RepID=UPI003D038133